ncbi:MULTISPECIES: YihY family inner membrane protein [Helicobacter]|uniref:YihY family inner membrane protein n=1 Tax=Helicobacter ibis TaxID=2962633 RepID=A0ABT4VCD0_9HELI|nr:MULTISPECIES: YihY family inner membrane protein [Helicobacter]MDA3967602.1 YihY family inner membrane protein [Helicobacter sp. WB40]MDA3968356.1 YihY family inner membrane protein [Helicobacter ibis]
MEVVIDIKSKIYLLLRYLYAFLRGDLLYFAASLSFYTIFALLPMLLIVFSIVASLPEFSKYLEHFKNLVVTNFIPTHSDVFLGYIDSFLKNSLKLGGMGLLYAFITSILFFRNYQFIASKIFHSNARGFWDSLSVYWTCMTLFPIGILFSMYFSAKAYIYLDSLGYTKLFSFLYTLLPYFITWILFFILFKISANTKISTKNTITSSLVTAVLWSLCKHGFVYYVFYNKAYLTLYGSFSIVLFLFIWVYLSWTILLFGMGLSRGINEVFIKEMEDT